MPFRLLRLKLILPIMALAMLLMGAPGLRAQDESPHEPLDIATILNPSLEGTVAPLDTLILIEIDEYYIGPDFYYLILLDDDPITARWDPDARTFSYYPGYMLSPAEHTIKVYMTQVDVIENELVAQGTFTVSTGGRTEAPSAPGTLFDLRETPQEPPPPSPVVQSYSSEFFNLTGRASVTMQAVDIDGLGARLRQEPDNTSVFDLSGRGLSEGNDFDFRLYLTSDDSKYQQSRNRYSFHLANDDFSFWVGDATPRLGDLTLDGQRLRGAYGYGTLGDFTLHLAHGEVRRETEDRYDDQGNLIGRGVGQRTLEAARLGLWEGDPFSLGLTFLHGQENEATQENYGTPGGNTVRAVDFNWELGEDAAIRGGWALADYDYDDPDEEDVSDAEGQFIEGTYQLGGHRFKLRWQSIDPGFVTLGRVSLQKDRETWSFEDRLNLYRNVITGRLYWEHYHNNLDDSLDFTTTNMRYGGQVQFRNSDTGTVLSAGLQRQDRSNDAIEGGTGWLDDNVTTINLGLNQAFELLGARHDLRVDWRTMDRDSASTPTSESGQETITVTLNSRWTRGFQLNLMYGTTDSEYPNRDTYTDVERYRVRASYTHPTNRYMLWSMWEEVDSDGTVATYNSMRETIEFGMKWMLSSDFSLETSLKLVDFDDMSDNANDFEEHTFRIMIIQNFN